MVLVLKQHIQLKWRCMGKGTQCILDHCGILYDLTVEYTTKTSTDQQGIQPLEVKVKEKETSSEKEQQRTSQDQVEDAN